MARVSSKSIACCILCKSCLDVVWINTSTSTGSVVEEICCAVLVRVVIAVLRELRVAPAEDGDFDADKDEDCKREEDLLVGVVVQRSEIQVTALSKIFAASLARSAICSPISRA